VTASAGKTSTVDVVHICILRSNKTEKHSKKMRNILMFALQKYVAEKEMKKIANEETKRERLAKGVRE
jgi:hypothetical protein